MTAPTRTRALATAMLGALSLLLTGCLVSPGKFESQLLLEKNGTFSFNYEGEVFFLGLSKLAQMDAANEEFEPDECYTDDYDERECTAAELAEQRGEWESGAEERAAKAAKQAQEMAQMMGGIDPTDPEATEELRQLLLRHKGWERVEHKGDGLFDVSFSISGPLTSDMMFPVIEGFPSANVFVQVIQRKGKVVRVNAPGFSAENNSNPMGAMVGGMAGLAGFNSMKQGSESGEDMPDMPVLDGTFRIITDGQIMANNTDEGPTTAPNGWQVLDWKIDQRTNAAPTALIGLAN